MANTILGIDIGSRNLHFCLVKQGKEFEVIGSVSVDSPNGGIELGELLDIRSIGEKINEVISKEKIKAKEMAICINSPEVVIREFSLPSNVKDSELLNALEFEVSKSFKGITNTHDLSFKIYERNQNFVEGVVCLCPKELVKGYIEMASNLKIPLKYLDVSPNCIAKAYKEIVLPVNYSKTLAIVDIGSNSTTVNIISKGRLKMSRTLAQGGAYLDKLMSMSFNMSLEEAEKIKETSLSSFIEGHDECALHLKMAYDSIEEEIINTLNYYMKSSPKNTEVEKIYLIGGGSLVLGLEARFTEAFNKETTILEVTDTTSKYISNLNSIIPALGAAIREE